MNRGPILLYLFWLFSAGTLPGVEPETIVPATDQVSEFDARRELANVLRRLGKTEAAEIELRKLQKIQPNNPGITADIADLETLRGHFARSRELYERALAESSNSIEIRLRYARQARSWGDFYLAERIFRTYLKEHPRDADAAEELVTVLNGEQQFEAAEGVYLGLSKSPAVREKALVGLATARSMEQDYSGVLPYTDAALKIDPDQIDALSMRGEALRRLRRYDEAKEPFQRLTSIPGGQRVGWIGLGRIARSQNDDVTAKRCFRRAQVSDPSDITAAYFAAGKQVDSFLATYPRRHNLGAAELSTLAGVCASDGRLDDAISFYQKALANDPEYFPARIGLAEGLGTAHRYDESIKILSRLRQEFPGDSRILLTLARELSYARRYDQSRQVYLELISANLADMVPRKEMARIATWNKQIREALQDYATIYTPSVDDQLVEALQRSEEGTAALSSVGPFPTADTPYSKYERLNYLLRAGRVPDRFQPAVATVLTELSPECHARTLGSPS